MTAFDVEGYRKAATAAGISKSEIENEIKFQTSAPAKTDPFEKDEGGFKLGSLEQVQERLGNDWWHLPAALAVFGAGIYGASKLMDDGDTPRPPPPPPPPPPPGGPGMRIDPTFDVDPLPQAPQAPAPAPDRLQQAQQLAEANRQLGIGGNQPVAPGPIVRGQLPGNNPLFSSSPKAPVPPTVTGMPPTVAEMDAAFKGPQAIPDSVGAPISAAPAGAPGPTSSASPGSSATTAVVDEVKDMIQKTPESGTVTTSQTAPETAKKPVPPVYPKAGSKFKTEADIPPGFVARYDVGNLDRSMGNILGIEHRANARDLFNQGKPFGQSANLNQDVSDLTKRYFQQLQSEIPETILGREARQAQKIPSEFGVFAKNTPFGTGVTVAGKAATLFALPHIANAAQQGNYGSAALQAADIATDYLPFVGQVKQALSPSSAGEGSTLSPQIVAQQKAYMDNLYRLGGGPLANTEAGERFRRNEEMTRRIAGRTGAAVPPQYRR
jgi:hypothetical protein